MAGEKNLSRLIQQMEPSLAPGAFVFCTVPAHFDLQNRQVVATFMEKEGKTLVLAQQEADELGLPYAMTMAWITLNVHSALEAVGLTAAVANALAAKNISCNVIAGYYHDHIFIPQPDADLALQTLLALSKT